MSLSADDIGDTGDEEQQLASKPLSPIMEIELSPLSKVSDEMTGLG
jgi:muconolactone delta-isomerase